MFGWVGERASDHDALKGTSSPASERPNRASCGSCSSFGHKPSSTLVFSVHNGRHGVEKPRQLVIPLSRTLTIRPQPIGCVYNLFLAVTCLFPGPGHPALLCFQPCSSLPGASFPHPMLTCAILQPLEAQNQSVCKNKNPRNERWVHLCISGYRCDVGTQNDCCHCFTGCLFSSFDY